MELSGCNVSFCNFLAAFWLLEYGKVIKLSLSLIFFCMHAVVKSVILATPLLWQVLPNKRRFRNL